MLRYPQILKVILIVVSSLTITLASNSFAIPIAAYNQYKLALKDFKAKNYKKAQTAFMKLANEQSYAPAMLKLGVIEQKGHISKPNYTKARFWLKRASELDNPDAQYHYAKMLERGLGGAKSIEEAAKWRKRSAKLGHKVSQYDLGVMYFYGKGVEQNIEEAAALLIRSADKGYKYSKSRLFTMKRLLVAKQKQGDPIAHYLLGTLNRKGYAGFRPNDADAFKLFNFAAEKKVARAQYEIAQLYFYGRHVKKSYAKAAEYYKLAADQGHVYAMKKLAVMHLNRQGGLSDKSPDIVPLLEKSAAGAHQFSQRKLGYMYLVGDVVKQDVKKAYELLMAAAKQNDAFAQRTVGQMYEKGNGVTKDLGEAAYWYTLALENGDKDAKELLESVNKR